ncbi:MAG TPA: hypothetical protein VD866_07980 [Urbifossiella sp.]|nr:hypothetical protein [Urbifossiella sp.]
MGTRSAWRAIGGTPLVVALPYGVKLTALGLDEGAASARLWVGLPLLAAGVVGVECLGRCVGVATAGSGRRGDPPDEAGPSRWPVRALQAALLVLLPVVTVLQFALLLDGHVRLRACGWVFLGWACGAAVGVGGRAGTGWGSRFLRWGWAPMVAFGVPLGLPILLATGLVRPAIPPG